MSDWLRSPNKPVGDAIGLVAVFDDSINSKNSSQILQNWGES